MQEKPSSLWLCNTINQVSQPKVLAALIGVYLIFPFVIFPASIGHMSELPLDLMFAYSPAEAYALLTALGTEGRQHYMFGTTVSDVGYAISYTCMFCVWLTLLRRGRTRFLCAWSVAPLAVFVLDMIENTGVALMLANFPEEIYGLALATSIATTVKWLLAWPLILTTIGLSLWRGGQFMVSQRRKKTTSVH